MGHRVSEKIAKQTRAEAAYDQLKIQILNNDLPAGFQAMEPELALKFGVSRTTIREALIRLTAEGLVEMIPRRGARVLPLRADDMREIYQVLIALEPEAAASIADTNPSEQDLRPLVAATAAMEQALEQEDLEAWAAADDLFHRSLLDLNGNKRVEQFVSSLLDQAHRARIVTLRLREVPKKSSAEHRELLNYLRSGNAKEARRCFRNHRERAAGEILSVLEKYKLAQL